MSQMSNWMEENLLNHIVRAVALTFPANWHVALYTADPTEAGSGAEVSTGVWTNYARQAVTRGTGGWSAAASEGGGGFAVDNAALIDFGTAAITGTAPVVTHIGIRDASTSGNLWWYGALAESKTINNGDPVSFAIGALDLILR